MDVIIGLKGGYKVCCYGCVSKISLGDAKIVKGKPYCPKCYDIVKITMKDK